MEHELRIALAGNPNRGKTTLFNALTGSNQYVGNWPGVTVEKKESLIKKAFYDGEEELVAVDLPGAYSMSPFTAEERVTSSYVKNENPDVVIGLFHMGVASVSKRTGSREDMAVTIARNVAGFDAIVCGHNGLHRSKTVESISGEKVILASPGRRGIYLLDIDITAERDGEGFKNKKVDVAVKSMLTRKADNDYIVAMRPRVAELRKFTNTPVGNVKNMALSIDALFGSSAYIDFMHKVQLNYTGADFSIAHPYVIDEGLFEGPVSPSQIRNICPFDGKLYTVKMTGEEIEKMLSHSVSQFYKLMKKKEDDLLKYDAEKKRMKENCKSLESVGGLRYNVHVNKKTNDGKLQIIGLSNGKKLEPKKEYKVAVRSM